MKDTSRAAANSATAILSRLGKQGRLEALMEYIGSDKYAAIMARLNRTDRLMVAKAQFAAQEACCWGKPIPPRWSMRVSWTPEMIAKLKAADRKHGTDEGIARELGIPFANAKRARRRFIGLRHPKADASAA